MTTGPPFNTFANPGWTYTTMPKEYTVNDAFKCVRDYLEIKDGMTTEEVFSALDKAIDLARREVCDHMIIGR